MITDLQKLEDAWLGIDVDESTIFNPMTFISECNDRENY